MDMENGPIIHEVSLLKATNILQASMKIGLLHRLQ